VNARHYWTSDVETPRYIKGATSTDDFLPSTLLLRQRGPTGYGEHASPIPVPQLASAGFQKPGPLDARTPYRKHYECGREYKRGAVGRIVASSVTTVKRLGGSMVVFRIFMLKIRTKEIDGLGA
jgi:hypothetical protein